MSADKAGFVKLAPGVYADTVTNTLHLDVAELLEDNGYAVTPENAAMVEKATRKAFAELGLPVDEVTGW